MTFGSRPKTAKGLVAPAFVRFMRGGGAMDAQPEIVFEFMPNLRSSNDTYSFIRGKE